MRLKNNSGIQSDYFKYKKKEIGSMRLRFEDWKLK